MTTAVIIRFHYEKDDPRFDWRFAYFQAMVLPRLQKQTDQNFVIAIRCNPWHADKFKALDNKIITFQVKNEGARYKNNAGKKYFLDFAPWKNVIGLEKYDIQIGLDSDDLISYNFIERIHQEINKNNQGFLPTQSLHISFQPMIFNARNLTTRSMRTKYGPRKGSAFMALYQPNKNNYKFLYEDSHLRLWRYAGKSIIIPEGYCWATVHNINESTGV